MREREAPKKVHRSFTDIHFFASVCVFRCQEKNMSCDGLGSLDPIPAQFFIIGSSLGALYSICKRGKKTCTPILSHDLSFVSLFFFAPAQIKLRTPQRSLGNFFFFAVKKVYLRRYGVLVCVFLKYRENISRFSAIVIARGLPNKRKGI